MTNKNERLKKNVGRPRAGIGKRIHISGRIDEVILEDIHSTMTNQQFIDYAVEKFIKDKSKKQIKKAT